ncbi:MAG TPA: hypothetical protein VJ891_00180 [Casimicrobiaceae bacterium]|nr:hypothetical protein [Casimicrobiaceae bacterium]
MPVHVMLRYAGFVVLLGGLLAAVAIYLLAGSDADANAAAAITRQKMYEHNIALIGGKGAIYAVRLNEWLSSLWHGTTLAYTIAVLSVVLAAACFGLAWLMALPPQGGAIRGDADKR